jgi:hypothetical protein
MKERKTEEISSSEMRCLLNSFLIYTEELSKQEPQKGTIAKAFFIIYKLE